MLVNSACSILAWIIRQINKTNNKLVLVQIWVREKVGIAAVQLIRLEHRASGCKAAGLMPALGITSFVSLERRLTPNFLTATCVVWKASSGVCFPTAYTRIKQADMVYRYLRKWIWVTFVLCYTLTIRSTLLVRRINKY